MKTFTMSETGLNLTKSFEGLRLEAYKDSGGIWTIGYGHTSDNVRQGLIIKETEAEALLRADMAAAIGSVNRLVTTELEQHQFDALVDFCFNVGCGHFQHSNLLTSLNQRRFPDTVQQFGKWVTVGAQIIPGLVRRRAAEAALFCGTLSAAGR